MCFLKEFYRITGLPVHDPSVLKAPVRSGKNYFCPFPPSRFPPARWHSADTLHVRETYQFSPVAGHFPAFQNFFRPRKPFFFFFLKARSSPKTEDNQYDPKSFYDIKQLIFMGKRFCCPGITANRLFRCSLHSVCRPHRCREDSVRPD